MTGEFTNMSDFWRNHHASRVLDILLELGPNIKITEFDLAIRTGWKREVIEIATELLLQEGLICRNQVSCQVWLEENQVKTHAEKLFEFAQQDREFMGWKP